MKPGSIFWVIDYIKAHRDKETRYEIDLYLLRLGYDAGTIEDAWTIAGLNLDNKRPAFFKYLFPLTALCSLLSWLCLLLPWFNVPGGWGYYAGEIPLLNPNTNLYGTHNYANSGYLYLSLIMWGINSFAGLLFRYTGNGRKEKPYTLALALNFVFIMMALVVDIILIYENYSSLAWTGPICLTTVLLVGVVCTFLEFTFTPRKIEVVLPAHSSK